MECVCVYEWELAESGVIKLSALGKIYKGQSA
jgi:hypothetical protein